METTRLSGRPGARPASGERGAAAPLLQGLTLLLRRVGYRGTVLTAFDVGSVLAR